MYVVWNYISIMNVFDFDGTIYDGDSSINFWLFCLKNDIKLIRFFPLQVSGLFLYIFKFVDKKEFKKLFFKFLQGIKDIDACILSFWIENENKIKGWYKEMQASDDCIISASPDFLLRPICKKIGINNLIATNMDQKTGNILGENCYGTVKPILFKEKFGKIEIENFYSDSKSDLPMALLAGNAYFVKKNQIQKWDEE